MNFSDTKTTEEIHQLLEMNNYGEPDISKKEWLPVDKVQKEINATINMQIDPELISRWGKSQDERLAIGRFIKAFWAVEKKDLYSRLGLLEEEKLTISEDDTKEKNKSEPIVLRCSDRKVSSSSPKKLASK